MEVCVCGNELGPARCKVRTSPCRCAEPGEGRKQLSECPGFPSGVPERQCRERRAVGLPVMTDRERAHFQGRWV